MAVFEHEALRRLPLAEAAYRLLDHVTDDDFLADVFRRHGGAAYEKVITFPVFVHLIADALLEHHGSGHQSFTRAREDGSLATSLKAAYGKLARTPLGLSCGFFAAAGLRLRALCPPVCRATLPDSLAGFTVLVLDGKKVKHVAKKLKILRGVKGPVLAAKLVVALDLRSGLGVGLGAHPDGEASDAPLVPAVLAQVRAQTAGPLLWVEDRQFCDLNQPRLVRATGDHYLIRYNAKVGFHPDPARPAGTGVDGRGRAYRQEWGWLGSAGDARRQYVRRITLERPGAEDVILVTDLLDGDAYPAADLLEVYRHRWGIERVFQRITEVFHLRRLIGSTPQAGVFQAAFCLLLYNVLEVVRGYVSEAQGQEPEAVSMANLFTDVHRQVVALQEVLSAEEVVAVFAARPAPADLRGYLAGLLAGSWSDRWLKAKAAPAQPTPPGAKEYLKGGHTSVYRLLRQARGHRDKPEPHGRN